MGPDSSTRPKSRSKKLFLFAFFLKIFWSSPSWKVAGGRFASWLKIVSMRKSSFWLLSMEKVSWRLLSSYNFSSNHGKGLKSISSGVFSTFTPAYNLISSNFYSSVGSFSFSGFCSYKDGFKLIRNFLILSVINVIRDSSFNRYELMMVFIFLFISPAFFCKLLIYY